MSPILTGVIASGISGHLTPPWSPEGAYDALATVTVPSGGTASIEFAGIPTGYKHLQLRGISLSASPNNAVGLRYNNDSSSNYIQHAVEGNGISGTVAAYSSGTTTLGVAGYTGDATYPSSFVCDILDYSSNTKNKVTRALSGNDANSTGARYIALISSLYNSTNPITSITVFHGASINFNEHSQFALYGVK